MLHYASLSYNIMKNLLIALTIVLSIFVLGFYFIKNFVTENGISFTDSVIDMDQTNVQKNLLPNNASNTIVSYPELNFETASVKIPEQSSDELKQYAAKLKDTDLLPLRTGAWWSHPIVNDCNTNVFSYPYGVNINSTGFEISLLEPVSSESNVMGNTAKHLNLSFSDTQYNCQVEQANQLNANFALNSTTSDSKINLVATKGSSNLYYVAKNTPNLTLNSNDLTVIPYKKTKNEFLIKSGQKYFGIKFSVNADLQATSESATFNFDLANNAINSAEAASANQNQVEFIIFYLPSDETTLVDAIWEQIDVVAPLITTDLKIENGKFSQTFTADNGHLLFLMPHQAQFLSQQVQPLYSINTIRGNMLAIVEKDIKIDFPTLVPEIFPEILLDDGQKVVLLENLQTDIESIEADLSGGEGAYWKGKMLARYANLLYVAQTIGATQEAKQIYEALDAELADWAKFDGENDEKYFYYDPELGGILNSKPEFGHERYNDHHFHYAYWIYTFASLQNYNQSVVEKYGSLVEGLIQSTASFEQSQNQKFPYLRMFDLYEGHSWASGLNYFADGNNQESTSEAVTFWYASYMWYSQLASNTPSTDEKAQYNQLSKLYLAGYNLEATTANTYWLNTFDRDDIFPQEYKHLMASLIWEGKYDFATWFSGHPKAIHGIQMIPINLGSIYLTNPEYYTILNNSLQNEIENTDEQLAGWDDILLSYKIISKQAEISEIDDVAVTDSGLSKTWLYMLKFYSDLR